MSCVGADFSNRILPSACGEKPLALAISWAVCWFIHIISLPQTFTESVFWLKDKWREREIKWKERLSWMTVEYRKNWRVLWRNRRWTTELATAPGIRSLFWFLSGYLRSVKHGCESSCIKTSAKWKIQVAMVVNNNQSRNLFFIHQTYKLVRLD